MSARFVSIRRKRSRAWSSRRRDRRPRRRLLYLASREASSLTGSSPDAPLANSGAIGELFEEQEVPLLVVLLDPAFPDPFEDAPREIGPRVRVGDRDVGDVLPRLVGHAGDHLEDLELRQGPPAAIEEIQRDEQDPREEAVAHPRRRQGLALGTSELLRRQALHAPGPCPVSAVSPWPPPPAGARSLRRG